VPPAARRHHPAGVSRAVLTVEAGQWWVGDDHEALLRRHERLTDTYGTVKYDIRAVTAWEKWTDAIAVQFGLSPADSTMSPPFAPLGTRGDVTYCASFDAVSAQAPTSRRG
jgi:hypothetical protein